VARVVEAPDPTLLALAAELAARGILVNRHTVWKGESAQDQLSLRKDGLCVSTVSIAGRCPRRLHGWSRVGPIAADAADVTDGADGIFQ